MGLTITSGEWEGSASSSGSHCTVSRSAADRLFLLLFLLPHLLFLPSVLSVKSRATCFAEAVVVAAVSAAVVVIVGHGLRSEAVSQSVSQSKSPIIFTQFSAQEAVAAAAAADLIASPSHVAAVIVVVDVHITSSVKKKEKKMEGKLREREVGDDQAKPGRQFFIFNWLHSFVLR